jgi:Spy/CpxP family protein refolding chaperone
MKRGLKIAAVGLVLAASLAGASTASANPYWHHHHHHMVCGWRHHHHFCWRGW